MQSGKRNRLLRNAFPPFHANPHTQLSSRSVHCRQFQFPRRTGRRRLRLDRSACRKRSARIPQDQPVVRHTFIPHSSRHGKKQLSGAGRQTTRIRRDRSSNPHSAGRKSKNASSASCLRLDAETGSAARRNHRAFSLRETAEDPRPGRYRLRKLVDAVLRG